MLRRPVSFLLLAFAGGILLQYWAGEAGWPLAPALMLLPVMVFLALARRRRAAWLFLLAALLGAGYFFLAESRVSPLLEYEDRVVTVSGRVESVLEKDAEYYRLVVVAERYAGPEADGGRLAEKVLVNLSGDLGRAELQGMAELKNPQDLTGRVVTVKGKVSLPAGQRNPGLFDYKLYLKTRGIQAILAVSPSHLTVEEGCCPFWNGIGRLKYRFTATLEPLMEPEALAVLIGMLFGDKEPLGDELYEVFQRNGVGHLLAVSGIHVGIIYLYVNMIFGRRGGRAVPPVILALLLFYAALASFSPSVVRAVVMIGSHLLARILRRRYDLLCCCSFSAFLMLLWNPYNLFAVGFQLSFLAVFSLAFLLPPMEIWAARWKERGGRAAFWGQTLKVLGPLLAIQIGMIPATAYLFNYFSVAAFFLNPPAIALAGFLIPLGMLLLPLCFVGGHILGLAATATELLARLLIGMNLLVYQPGLTAFPAASPGLPLLLLFYGGFFFCASEQFWIFLRRRDRRRPAAVFLILLLLALLLSWFLPAYEEAGLVFVDVGQGDCLHIRTPGGKNVLIDGGGSSDYDVGKKVLLPYLLKQGVRQVDLALVTHLHQDHYGGIASLARLLPVKQLGLYEGNRVREAAVLEETGLPADALIYLSRGQRIELEEGIWIDVLYPEAPAMPTPRAGQCPAPTPSAPATPATDTSIPEDENAFSLLLQVNYLGTKVLMTADLGFPGEEAILTLYKPYNKESLRGQILKVGHHGSRYSTSDAFLKAVDPEIAVIQAGKNNFGHPHPDVLEKLQKNDIIVYDTLNSGAVLFYFEPEGLRIQTML